MLGLIWKMKIVSGNTEPMAGEVSDDNALKKYAISRQRLLEAEWQAMRNSANGSATYPASTPHAPKDGP